MSASRPARAAGTLLVAAAIAAITVGCTPAAPRHDTQTVAAACATLSGAVDGAMTDFAEADAADPAAAATATAAVRTTLRQVSGSIDNARVEAIVADLRAGFDVLADASADAAAGDLDGATGLADATDRIRTAVSDYHDLCGR